MKKILIFIFCTFLFSDVYASKIDEKKTIDSLTTEMSVSKGLITTYTNEENELYFEISENLLDKELLVVTRLAQLPGNYAGYLNAGSKTAEHVIQFEKNSNKILIFEGSKYFLPISSTHFLISISISTARITFR